MGQAEKIYTRVFFNLIMRWSDTSEFRQIAALVEGDTLQKIADSNRTMVLKWFVDPEYRELLPDDDVLLDRMGGVAGVGRWLTDRQLGNFRDSVDQAAIVFMHSTLDAATSDLCRVTALEAPDKWRRFLRERKVTLTEAIKETPEDLLASLLEAHLEELERQSLVSRVDRLFAICQPGEDFVGIDAFTFDRGRLKQIDRVRHDIVHGSPDLDAVRPLSSTLQFLLNVGLHLFALVNWRFGVKMDPLYSFPDNVRESILRVRAKNSGDED